MAYTLTTSVASFSHTYRAASFSIPHRSISAGLGQFFHVYMGADLAVVNSIRAFLALQMPPSRQMVDPNTGMLTPAWQQYLKQLHDAVNLINQNNAQGV